LHKENTLTNCGSIDDLLKKGHVVGMGGEDVCIVISGRAGRKETTRKTKKQAGG
jgi:hypothetical protein